MGHLPPTREEHPLPAVIMHAVHAISLILLVFTGFYIHSPFFGGFMGYAESIHQVAMWTFVFTTVIRIYWAFFGAGSAPPGRRNKMRDFHWFSPIKHKGEGNFRDTLKYYLFLRKTYPSIYKFNPLQKGTYLFWVFCLIPLTLLTGLCLWAPTRSFEERPRWRPEAQSGEKCQRDQAENPEQIRAFLQRVELVDRGIGLAQEQVILERVPEVTFTLVFYGAEPVKVAHLVPPAGRR